MPRRAFVLLLLALTGLGADAAAGQALRLGAPAPDLGGEHWINGGPLTMPGLRGHVVLLEFWTYG